MRSARADIHNGQGTHTFLSRAGYRNADLLSPDHHFWLATRGRSIQKCQFGYRKVRYRGIAKNGAPGVLAVGARKPVSRPQDICVRLTTPGHPLPPAAVSWRL